MIEWPYAHDTLFFQVSHGEEFNKLFAFSERPLATEIARCGLPYYPSHPQAAYIQAQFMSDMLSQGTALLPTCLTSVDLSMGRLEPDSLYNPSEFTEVLLLRHAVCDPADRQKILVLFLIMRVLMVDNNSMHEYETRFPREKALQDSILANFTKEGIREEEIFQTLAPLFQSEARFNSLRTTAGKRAPFMWEKKTLGGFTPARIREHPVLVTDQEKAQWKILHVPTGYWIQGFYLPSEMSARMAIEELLIRARERDIFFEDYMSQSEFANNLNILADILT